MRTRAWLVPASLLALAALLAVVVATAAIPVSSAQAKSSKPTKGKHRTLRGVEIDGTGLPLWLSESIGPETSSGAIGDFRFPATLDSVAKLQLDSGWVGFRMLASPRRIQREEHQRGVVYRTPRYDVVQHVRDDERMREAIVVRKRLGVRTWRWQLVRSGKGIAPRLASDGQVVWGDGAYIDRPAVHDFDGTKTQDLSWRLRGSVLELRVDDRRLALPYVIDPPMGADTTPPVVTFDGFVENTPAYTHVNSTGNTLYYNPSAPGSFGMQVRATDAQSLISYVTFPNLGTGWSAGGNDTTGWSGASAAPNTGTGLNGGYQNYWSPCAGMGSPASAAFDGVGFTRLDGPINFDWANGYPGTDAQAAGIGQDCFTVRWMGYFEAPSTGSYWFRTRSDDGVRLWVDGYLSNDLWTEHAVAMRCGGTNDNSPTTGIALTAGQRVPIVMDFNENGGQAVIGLQYRTNAYTNNNNASTGCTAAWTSGGWTVVPASRLYQAEMYEWTYNWTAGPAVPPTGLGITARDAAVPANVSTPKNFAVIPDSTGPTGGSISAPTGLRTNPSVTITTNKGTDAATQTIGSSRIEMRTQPLVNGACTGALTAWSTLVTNPPNSFATTFAGGTCYWFRLVSVDGVGNESTFNGSATSMQVDDDAPTGYGSVQDGPTAGTDLSYFSTAGSVSATWGAISDPWSGVASLQYCIGTSANASGCTGTSMQAWTNVPGGVTATSVTRTGLALTLGTSYYTCIRATDGAGNQVVACSNGQAYDNTAPSQPGTVNDGTGADISVQASTTTLQGNWTAATDAQSGVVGYQTCVTTSATGADCAGAALGPWNATAAGLTGARSGLALATGTTYYFCVRAENGAGLVGALRCSNGVNVDDVGPLAPAFAYDIVPPSPADQDWTSIATSLAASWSTATDPSGILRYELCLTASSVGADCTTGALRPFATTGLATSFTVASLSLAEGSTWFACARAVDSLGNVGAASCSDGITVDTTAPGAVVVSDGSGADVTWTASATTSTANWTAASDGAGSGVASYRYCVKGMTGGVDCSSGTIHAGPSTSATTSATVATGIPPAGTQHRFCVAAVDAAGNAGPWACSNRQTADTTAPSTPTAVADSLGADIDFQSSTSTVQANWGASSDGAGSGLQQYDYCVTTNATGSNCAGAAMVPWTSNALVTTLTRAGLSLVNGSTYHVCVRARDAVGNSSGTACSDGVVVDAGPPVWPVGSSAADGAGPSDAAWTTSPSMLSSFWSAATDPSGVARYEFCVATSADCTSGVVVPWTSTGTTRTQTSGPLVLAEGATYYTCVRAFDSAGNQSADLCSNGQRLDSVAPVLPAVVSDGTGADLTWLTSLSTASANWPGGSDATSGIGSWEYCISTGTACSGGVVKGWTSSGVATTQTSGGLTLVEGQLYYTCVRGSDVAGNSTVGSACSNGQRVDSIAPPAPGPVNDGTGADIAFQADATRVDANWASVSDPLPGVGSASGLARYEYCVTTNAAGSDCAGGAVVTWTVPATPTATASSATGLTLTNGLTYRTCVRGVDAAGNAGAPACSNGVVVDTGPPAASWTSWTETSDYLYSPGGSVLWFNPAAPAAGSGSATATVTATDPGAGMNRVEFPNLGAAGWGTGGTDTTVGPANTWSWTYSFTGGGAIGTPAPNHATAFDNGGAFTGSPQLDFDVRSDSTPPSGGTSSALPGTLQRTTSVVQSVQLGTDSGAGVGRWVTDVDFAPLVDGACGAWDGWTDGSTIPGYSGTGSNGSSMTFTHHLNDPNFDGTPDLHDSFCFRTQVRVLDNVGNSYLIPTNGVQRFDFAAPQAAITAPANGSAQGGTFTIDGSAHDVWAGGAGEYPNTGSGVQQVAVTYELPDGPDADSLPDATGSACAPVTAFTGPWTGLAWSCSWSTSLLPDGLYTVRAQATDRAGNVSTIATRTYLLDNNAPVAAWHAWNDHASAATHATGTVAWVNPNAATGSYQLDAIVTAYDLGSGVASVTFPALGAGWLPGSSAPATLTSPVPVTNAYTMAYSFTNPAAVAASGPRSATAVDGAGNASAIGFEVRLDGNAPTGMAASVTSGRQSTPVVATTLAGGSDSALESGLASWSLLYDTAPLAGDSCGAFAGAWSVAASGAGIAPASYGHDVTALGSGCYRYVLQATDNVGNVGASAPSAARRVDLVAPTVAITTPVDGAPASATFTVSGTAVDAHTGIGRVALDWTGPSVPSSGTICANATLTGSAPTYGFSCPWATASLPDGTYTVTATAWDVAGNASSAHQITVILDNHPPFIGFHSFVETSPYTHWQGTVGTDTTLWYNPDAPAGTYSFDVRVSASDPGGVDRVEFDGAGTGWTPGGSVATQTTGIGPADRYSQTYSFSTAGALVAPPVLHATAFDPAGNPADIAFDVVPDSANPANGSVSYAGGFATSTSVAVTRATGDDGTGSGIASWQLQRSDGALGGGSCSAWGAFTTVASGSGTTSGTTTDTVPDPGCVRYRMVVTDNVGRTGTFTSASEVMVDLAPPTGSVVLSEGANPQYQHLASPTRLFVNTSAGASGDFHVDATATAASGVLDVAFPVLASGFTGNGAVPGPGPSFPRTYSWSGPAAAPAAPANVHVRSNSLGSLDLPFEVVADATAPTAAAPTHASGFTTTTSVPVSYTTGGDGAGSGVAQHQLERETGTLSGGACAWSGTWTAFGPVDGPATQVDASLVTATCYRYRTAVTDNVGNVGRSAPSAAVMVDTTPPTSATIVLAEGANPTRQHLASPDTIWVAAAPGAPSTFTATVTAADPESGTGTATFPTLGSTFALTPTGPYSASYAWNDTATAPGAPSVLVANGAGLTTAIPFTVRVDGTPPTGATLDQEAGFVTDYEVGVTFAGGSDGAGSGIASWRLERRSATYSVGPDTCGTWGAWTSLGQPTSPLADTAVVQPTCYQYRIVEVDNVGNVEAVTDGDTAKVITDIFPPAPFALNLPTNPALPAVTTGAPLTSCETAPTFTSSTPTLSWTASSDAESGLQGYDVFVDGTSGAADANVAAPGTSWTSPTLADGAHSIGVRALDNEHNGTTASPAFPTAFRVDTAPPTASLAAPAAGSWTSDTTPTLDWTATDANCVARVEVSVDGVPVAVASGTEGSWTPAAPLANGSHTWSFTVRDPAGNSTSSGPHAFGVDTTPPAPFAITSPASGTTVRGFIDVTWAAATDAESGLAAATAYQVLRDGAVVGSFGPGTTSARVTPIANGAHTVVVRAFDAVGNATDTPSVAFTGHPAILPPTLVAPAAGAFVNAVPALSWSWAPDGGPAPTGYEAFVDGASAGTTAHPTSSLAIADPTDGSHTWRVEQTDPYTGTVTSTSRTFVLDRTAPINPGPLTRSVNVMSWPAPTDPAAPVASGIDRQAFLVDDGTTTTSVALPATTTAYNFGTLPDGTYAMRVRAWDKAGNATDSSITTVVNDTVPPTAFSLAAPAPLPAAPAITNGLTTDPSCMSDPTYVTSAPTLSWSASTDATSGLAGYDVHVDGTFAATVPAGTTSWTPGTPLPGGTHSWAVVARDNFGLTRDSSPRPLNVRVDAAAPTASYGAPAAGAFTADTTPTFSWTASDDSCLARVELTVGASTYVLTGSATNFTPTTVLPEGPTTWSVRAFDSAGNVVSAGAPRTVNVDTTAPTGVTAVFPASSGSAPEDMMTFQWSAGSDGGGSGVDHYDLVVDGTPAASNVAGTSRGTFPIHAGAHTWAVRAYDAVGNSALFTFSFTATPVPDVTPPSAFDLRTPADGAPVPAGTALTWDAAWDFKGVVQYRVYIDNALAATTSGSTTSFTPATGSGAPICTVGFDPAPSAGCLGGPSFSYGTRASTTATGLASYAPWNVASYTGWSASGAAIGVGDPTVSPRTQASAGYDGNRAWTAMEYSVAVPASGADLRFLHRYAFHANGESGYDGGTVEVMVDKDGGGFGNDAWETTCEKDTRANYGTEFDCTYEIMDKDGGYNAVMGGATKVDHPLSGEAAFSGTSTSTVQSRLSLAGFAGKDVKVRFRIGTDGCYTGISGSALTMCELQGATGIHPAIWRIDDVSLADPALLPGPHQWYVVARDAAGNSRQSTQTWTFDLQP